MEQPPGTEESRIRLSLRLVDHVQTAGKMHILRETAFRAEHAYELWDCIVGIGTVPSGLIGYSRSASTVEPYLEYFPANAVAANKILFSRVLFFLSLCRETGKASWFWRSVLSRFQRQLASHGRSHSQMEPCPELFGSLVPG